MYLIFDTETTGIPHNKTAPITDLDDWPRLVQIAWQLHDTRGKLVARHNYIVRPDGFDIPYNAQQIHGISTQRALEEGKPVREVIDTLLGDVQRARLLVGHNIEFDKNIIGAELIRLELDPQRILEVDALDTGVVSTPFCQLAGGIGGKLKMPRLTELHEKLFGEAFADAHDACYDVDATARCFFGLMHAGVVTPAEGVTLQEVVYEKPDLDEANFARRESQAARTHRSTAGGEADLSQKTFCHLHTHSQFSVLQATPDIKSMVSKAKALNMKALALTDIGNMYGAFKFVREALNQEIKPIVGCEVFIAEERLKLKFTKDNPDKRYSQVLLARNKTGYYNLSRLCSLGFTEGLYGIYPRVDKALIRQFREGLLATTGNLTSEVPHLILNVGERQAEEAFQWWLELFGDDFYVELNRHGIPQEDHVNEVLLRFAAKYNVKYFAANEAFYLDVTESDAHDVLLCIKEGEFRSTPIGHGRGHRYGLPNNQYYFKSAEEMKA